MPWRLPRWLKKGLVREGSCRDSWPVAQNRATPVAPAQPDGVGGRPTRRQRCSRRGACPSRELGQAHEEAVLLEKRACPSRELGQSLLAWRRVSTCCFQPLMGKSDEQIWPPSQTRKGSLERPLGLSRVPSKVVSSGLAF